MINKLNKFFFVPILILIMSMISFVPANNNGGYVEGVSRDIEVPEYVYSNTQRDDIWDGISWVNSAVKQNGYGFSNLNLGFSYDWDNDYFISGDKGVVYLSAFIDVPDVDYLRDYWGDHVDVDFNLDVYPGDSGSFDLVYDYGSYEVQSPYVNGYDFNLDYLLQTIGFTLVDRDIDTSVNWEVVWDYPGSSIVGVQNHGKFSLHNIFGFGVDFPTYSYVRSFLLAVPNFVNQLMYDTIGWDDTNPNFRGELNTYFLPVGDYYINDTIGKGTYDYGGNVDNLSQDGILHYYDFNMKNKVNVLTIPDDYYFQGAYTFLFDIASTFNNNAPSDGKLSKTYFSTIFELSEFNVFSDEPVIGGFSGGNVEYENVAWYDIFGQLRNFVKWLLFDSFFYSAISPILDPIYSLINDFEVFIYNVINMLGWADIYYNTTSQFFVNMLFNIFMVYVIFKIINFFG